MPATSKRPPKISRLSKDVVLSELKFRALVENATDAISLLDQNGKLIYVSPSSKKITGFDPKEVLGQGALEKIHPEDMPRVIPLLKYVAAHPNFSQQIELRVKHKNGSWVWIEATGINLLKDPLVKAIVINSREISERKEKEMILESIYSSVEKFLTQLTVQQTYEYLVTEAAKLVKATSGSLYMLSEGQLTRRYSTVPSSQQLSPRKNGYTYRVFRTGQAMVMSKQQLIRAHPEINHNNINSIVMIPLYNQNKPIGVLNLQSTRKDHFNSETLRILKLFGSLATLAIRKAELYDEVSKALETRDYFISLTSHELKTPLTAIGGYSQLLYSHLQKNDRPNPEWAKSLYYEVIRMTKMLNELLQIDQIKTGQLKFQFEDSNLEEIAQRAIADLKITHPDYRVIYTKSLKGRQMANLDFDKILQVIINLLNNAAKHSSLGSPIYLNFEVKNKELKISIRDRGEGIRSEDLPRVFEGFYRGSNFKRDGMGLGLYLAKTIVEAHQGTIKIASKVGQGTRVTIIIPII